MTIFPVQIDIATILTPDTDPHVLWTSPVVDDGEQFVVTADVGATGSNAAVCGNWLIRGTFLRNDAGSGFVQQGITRELDKNVLNPPLWSCDFAIIPGNKVTISVIGEAATRFRGIIESYRVVKA